MLDRDTRSAILRLAQQGHGLRTIARALGVSRNAVREVLRSGQRDVPGLVRRGMLDEHTEHIKALYEECSGNLVRVHEELEKRFHVRVAYQTLTSACRRHKIGVKEKRRVGRYHFAPGEEMQHDTSPHDVEIGGKRQRVQCASLVLCNSRRKYVQVYPRWTRLECRAFLTEAIGYHEGAARRCVVDNSSVVLGHGTGKDAVAAPVMQAQADLFGFSFLAHELGDKNRSAHVERRFHHVENNFYPGRTFADIDDVNRQLRQWCDDDNARHRRDLGTNPEELWRLEKPHLSCLPLHIPEVFDLHRRRVDVEGYVSLHTNRYSVDTELIGRHVELREGVRGIRIFDGHRLVETHDKRTYGARQRVTLEKHREWLHRRGPPPPLAKEMLLRQHGEELGALIDALKKRHGGRAKRAVTRLHRIWAEYPDDAVKAGVQLAVEHGLLDLERIEHLVLRHIAGEVFRLPIDNDENDENDDA